ncbi:response regulator transcription factor [Nitrosomonas sp.]|uniref:response regulator transcription factor n=1 Tax=Nitrosomonas sp. TaxID=42353 RepID=UPI002603A42D|nr:response regulator transcription factor [Nitrosomonas sp.]
MSDSSKKTIRVLLIEHYSIVHYGLEILINKQQPKMQVVGSFANCTSALPNLERLSPDVILLDMNLNSDKESQAILQLITLSHAKILILKWMQDSEAYDKAILAGAKGIIEKEATLDTILKAIEKVHEGQLWLNQTYIKKLIDQLSQQASEKDVLQEENKVDKLTPKEKKIFFTMIENAGVPAKVISNKLNISESTLRNHLTSIYEKLEVSNKLELWSYVHKHKLKQK